MSPRRATVTRRIAQIRGASTGILGPTEEGVCETINEGLAEGASNE